MRILQISSAQSLGGGERHLVDLASGLVDAGHEVYVVVRPDTSLTAELKNVPRENLKTLPLRNSLDAMSARALAQLVKREKIEIVHAHMARDYPLAAYAARRNPAARLIVTRHVLFPLNRLHRITLSHASRIIAVSNAVAKQLLDDRVTEAEKIGVVLNGIDVGKFAKAKEDFNRRQFFEEWALPPERLLVGMVGELSPLKGQREFLLAAVEILKQIPNAFFIVAGIDHSKDQTNRASCQELIRKLQLGDKVKLVGWLDNLAQLYSALDVFVSASHTESFGLAIAEAMASKTAVVATETEGAKEIIQSEMTGLLVPIGDVDKLTESIIALLRNPDRRLRIGTAAQQVVSERFPVERMIKETAEIYKAAIEKKLMIGRRPYRRSV